MPTAPDVPLTQIQRRGSSVFSARERALVLAVGRAAVPAGRVLPEIGERDVDRVEAYLARIPAMLAPYRALLAMVDAMARVRHLGRSYVDLSPREQLALLEWLYRGDFARRLAVRSLTMPLKIAHCTDPALYQAVGCVWDFHPPADNDFPRHVTERTISGRDLTDAESFECDVVVVGTGAGGAVVARELAELGYAVVLVEEGDYFGRKDFNGRAVDMQALLYRNPSETFSVGNTAILIPVGRTVGGTTTVNAGTCYRVPPRVLAEWREQEGLHEFTPEMLAPHYQRVEGVLGVSPNRPELLGGVARVIARGCDALGYRHAPLQRNAPDCDGKGVCTFGCPTDAKRSTNVSYVPLALRAGAQLLCAVAIDEILTEKGRAVGVRGVARGSGCKVTVRARAVVLACGALATPLLLEQAGLGRRSGMLGRNLSIHPAAAAVGLFDERIDGANAVPQGYAIEEFHDEGLLFEGATAPLDMGALGIPHLGARFTEVLEAYDHTAFFGYLIEDTSRGRIRRLPSGRPLITYNVNAHDTRQLRRGMEILARVFFAAGARSVLTAVRGFEEMTGARDLERFAQARLGPRDFELSAYHPLGTARMGADPRRSVVGPTHEVHDVPQLFLVDGSVMPSSLAVNPQLTIMAMATRAAPLVGRAVERLPPQ